MSSSEQVTGIRPKSVMDPTGWFFIPEPRPASRLRLFCFPYAGGWPWMFRRWPTALPDDVEVYAICVPGRGRRASEAAPASFGALVAALRDVMLPVLDRPHALFGHSFGALVAFELAAELERRGDPRAARVVLSGCAAPQTPRERAPLHLLPDDELTEVLRTWSATQSPALADPGVLAQTLALVRADLKLAELHRSSTAKLLSPMTVVFGSEDVAAPRAAADGWRAHAGGPFEIHEVIGDHFFVHQREAELLAILRRAVGHDG